MANISQLFRRQSSRQDSLCRSLSRNRSEKGEIEGEGPASVEQQQQQYIWQHKRRRGFQGKINPQDAKDQMEMTSLMWEHRPKYADIASGKRKTRNYADVVAGRTSKANQGPRAPKEGIASRNEAEEQNDDNEEKEDKTSSDKKSDADSESDKFKPPPGEERGEAWDSKITYVLATVGYAVGLGNVWRFPYLAQKNGGGAFLIPYLVMLLIEGLPIFLLELAIGQRLRKGSIGAWKQISKYTAGIGITAGIVSFNVALYYNAIIAWCLHYFARSFQYPLPWSVCPGNEGNLTEEVIPLYNECQASSPTQYFWYRETLNSTPEIDEIGDFNFIIFGCLLVAWLIVYFCMVKGITENPRVIHVTAIYPYVVLVIFFVRAMMLEGMSDGVIYLFKPKWEMLLSPIVWLEAGTQIFFSLGLAFGGLIAYSSYNPVNNNCTRDAVLVAATNFTTSIFAAIVIFAIMGFKANTIHKECLIKQNDTLIELFGTHDILVPEHGFVEHLDSDGILVNKSVPFCDLMKELDQSASGTGLAFILFTEAVNQFPFGNLWAVLFFLMLFTLGLDSQFGTLQGVIQCAIDLKIFPNLRKELLTALICGLGLVLSLVFCHGAGNYIFTLFDNFAGSVPLLIIALSECIAIAYVYGLKRFSDDIEMMTGRRPSLFWLICWKYLAPLAMLGILGASVVDMFINGSGYEGWDPEIGRATKNQWPMWALGLAFCLVFLPVMWIPIVAILEFFGINLPMLSAEEESWFPEDELREHYGIEEHKPSKIERFVLGIREDGTEGVCFPTSPHNNIREADIEENK